MTGDRERLAAAREAALRARSTAPLKALPVQLRTLGVGQVVAMLAEKGHGDVADALVAWINRVHPFGARATRSFIEAWRLVDDPAVIHRVESAAVAWAVDVRLVREMLAAEDAGDVPAPRLDLPWDDRDGHAASMARALADATRLGALEQAVQDLPHAIATDGVLRALAWRCRRREEMMLVNIVRDRLNGLPGFGVPQPLGELMAWLLDPRNADAAAVVEAEALAWAVALKRYIRAYAQAAA